MCEEIYSNQYREQRAEETILQGSVHEAIFNNFSEIEDLLEYLLDSEGDEMDEEDFKKRNVILNRKAFCYRNICAFSEEQMVKGKHFILQTDNEIYLGIFALCFPYYRGDHKVIQKLQKIYPKVYNEFERFRFCHLLCDNVEKFVPSDGAFVIAVRSPKNLHRFSKDVVSYLLADYLEPLENVSMWPYFDDFQRHCLHLKENAPLYWEMGKERYFEFAKSHFSSPPTKLHADFLEQDFPNILPENIKNWSILAFLLNQMNNYTKAYLLGFPIHQYVPLESVLTESLNRLSTIGIKSYCEEVKKRFKLFQLHDKVNKQNLQNVQYDKVEDFNTFDVINYYTDSSNNSYSGISDKPVNLNMFCFSRDEFKNLLKNGKNFYTNEKLPFSIMEEMRARQKIAWKYDLPSPLPLEEVLNKLNNGEEIFSRNVENEKKEKYIYGMALDPEGEEGHFRVRIPEDAQNLDHEEIDDLLYEMMENDGYQYLGRIDCQCEECDHHFELEEFEDDDEEEFEDDEEEFEDDEEDIISE